MVFSDFQGSGITGKGSGSSKGGCGGCSEKVNVVCNWDGPARDCPKDDPSWNCKRVETGGFSGRVYYEYPATCKTQKRFMKSQAELDKLKKQYNSDDWANKASSWCKSSEKYKGKDLPCGLGSVRVEPQAGFPNAKVQWHCGF